jgi:ribosomal-protein-alanine N-acetyltransferase
MRFDALPESSHALVSLRPIVEADLPVWYAYLSTPAVFEHTSWNLSSASDLSPYVWSPQAIAESSLLRLAIALRSTGELVGTAGFHTVSPQNRSAELAYDLAPSVWGKGIATDVCRLLVAWAHASAGLLRIQATVLESNLRSAAVLERCGFVREGLLRSYRLVRGRPGDFHMYAHVAPFPKDS